MKGQAIKRLLVTATALLSMWAFLGSTALAGKVYTWKDADGVVHYSAQPPASGNAQTLNIKTTPPSGSPSAEPAVSDNAVAEQPKDEKPIVVPTQEPTTLTAAQIKTNCERARQNLASLETRPRVLIDDKETGEKRVLNYDEHVDMIRKSREDVSKYCNG